MPRRLLALTPKPFFLLLLFPTLARAGRPKRKVYRKLIQQRKTTRGQSQQETKKVPLLIHSSHKKNNSKEKNTIDLNAFKPTLDEECRKTEYDLKFLGAFIEVIVIVLFTVFMNKGVCLHAKIHEAAYKSLAKNGIVVPDTGPYWYEEIFYYFSTNIPLHSLQRRGSCLFFVTLGFNLVLYRVAGAMHEIIDVGLKPRYYPSRMFFFLIEFVLCWMLTVRAFSLFLVLLTPVFGDYYANVLSSFWIVFGPFIAHYSFNALYKRLLTGMFKRDPELPYFFKARKINIDDLLPLAIFFH